MIQVGCMHDVILNPPSSTTYRQSTKEFWQILNTLSADSHPGSHGHASKTYAALILH